MATKPVMRHFGANIETRSRFPRQAQGGRQAWASEPIGSSRTMTSTLAAIPVIIVTFRNAMDADRCLHALSWADSMPCFAVYICENGGREAFDRIVVTLTGPNGPCAPDPSPPTLASPRFVRTVRLRLRTSNPSRTISVQVGEAVDNLGYGGGVNAWLEPLLAVPEWPGVWILNPDTEPAPDALKELAEYAARHGRGMVGSRLSTQSAPDIVHCRGLAWRKWRAATSSVDFRTSAAIRQLPDDVDRRLDAPSGASIYVTRDCVERIGLMDERYFLYFEDLDWGLRAKKYGGVGYAHRSLVMHEGGTTIGTSNSRHNQSPLSVYLDFRNRILFVRRHFALWLPWTVLAELAEIVVFARIRRFRNMRAAMRGMAAGLAGQTSRPDDMLRAHLMAAPTDRS
jgi:GT2 family glycosyltransferase